MARLELIYTLAWVLPSDGPYGPHFLAPLRIRVVFFARLCFSIWSLLVPPLLSSFFNITGSHICLIFVQCIAYFLLLLCPVRLVLYDMSTLSLITCFMPRFGSVASLQISPFVA